MNAKWRRLVVVLLSIVAAICAVGVSLGAERFTQVVEVVVNSQTSRLPASYGLGG